MRCIPWLLVSFLAIALPVRAQPAESPLQPGEVGLFFDAAGTQVVDTIALFETFELYLVARAPADGIDEYDLVDVRFPEGTLMLQSAPALPTATAFSFNGVADACSYASAAIPEQCPVLADVVAPLVRYSMMRVTGPPQLCLDAFECPTIAGPVEVDVRYRSCVVPGVDRSFTTGDFLCLSFDGTVATEQGTWSTTKAWFRRRR